jgi:hypothetical protein
MRNIRQLTMDELFDLQVEALRLNANATFSALVRERARRCKVSEKVYVS